MTDSQVGPAPATLAPSTEAPGADPAPPRTSFTYQVRRSDRARRARLTLTESGEAVVVLPRRAPLAAAAMLVEEHADWIERQRARLRLEHARLAERPALGLGRRLEVAGEGYRVAEVDALAGRPARGRVEASDGLLVVRLGRDGRTTRELLEAWLRDQARPIITARVGALAPHVGVRPLRIRIADQRSRWASASSRGTLSFSWRLVLTPPYVLDAIVVHELAHLRIAGHGRRFWTLVERHAPRTPEARRWLRANARMLRAALD